MKPGSKTYVSAISFFILMVGLFFLPSCSKKDSSTLFSRELMQIDELIASGDTSHALKKLISLRSRSSVTKEWLSIVKRERALGEYKSAVVTLQKALKKIPVNVELTAVMVDSLIELDRFDEACTYSESLVNSPYASLASGAEITQAAKVDPYKINPVFWQIAFETTGKAYFLRNAAVLLAKGGKLAEACSLDSQEMDTMDGRVSFPENDSYFQALLCYDALFFERVFSYLPLSDTQGRSLAEVSLMADAAGKMKNYSQAHIFWQDIISKYSSFSPLPYYNLSLDAISLNESADLLEKSLNRFPSYYPSVVRYVRSVQDKPPDETVDPIQSELKKAGFQTLEMKENIQNAPIDVQKARRVLDTALSKTDLPIDSRLLIEDFRFSQLQKSDMIRSSSEMWKLLEKSPGDPVLLLYAVWYFASIKNFDACFAVNRDLKDKLTEKDNLKGNERALFTGLEAALSGDLSLAEESFNLVANNEQDAWCALANIAQIRFKNHEYESAVDKYAIAAELATDLKIKSKLHYEMARILLELRYSGKAMQELGFALELDSSNYRASQLLREVEELK